jgi:hypothetical protein
MSNNTLQIKYIYLLHNEFYQHLEKSCKQHLSTKLSAGTHELNLLSNVKNATKPYHGNAEIPKTTQPGTTITTSLTNNSTKFQRVKKSTHSSTPVNMPPDNHLTTHILTEITTPTFQKTKAKSTPTLIAPSTLSTSTSTVVTSDNTSNIKNYSNVAKTQSSFASSPANTAETSISQTKPQIQHLLNIYSATAATMNITLKISRSNTPDITPLNYDTHIYLLSKHVNNTMTWLHTATLRFTADCKRKFKTKKQIQQQKSQAIHPGFQCNRKAKPLVKPHQHRSIEQKSFFFPLHYSNKICLQKRFYAHLIKSKKNDLYPP